MARRTQALAFFVITAFLSVGMATLLFGAFGSSGPPGWAAGVLKVFSIAALSAMAVIFVMSLKRPGRRATALAIERTIAGLNNNLTVSLDLLESKDLGRNIYSDALAQAYVSSAAAELENLDISPVIPYRKLRETILGAVGAMLAVIMIGFFMPDALRDASMFLLAPSLTFDEKAAHLRAEMPLVLGDMEIRYEFPAYTGREPVVQSASDGSIEALKGAHTRIRARSLHPISEASLRLEESTIPTKVADSRNIEVSIPVMKNGSYKLAATGAGGELYVETSAHSIKVIPDVYPKVELVEPREDVEVEEAGVLPLKFYADDDYGIRRVDVVYWLHGAEGRVTAVVPEDVSREVSGTYNWDIAALDLRPGDRVRYCIEVLDNDEVSGPKKSASRTLAVDIYSPRKEHRKIVNDQWELLHDMVALLGDVLEHEPPEGVRPGPEHIGEAKQIAKGMNIIIGETEDMMEAMKKDRYADYNTHRVLSNIRNDIEELYRRREKRLNARYIGLRVLATLKKSETPIVERDVLALDNALERQKVLDVLSGGEDMLDAQRSISELLAKAKGGDAEALKRLMSELERMREALQEMMKAMSRGAKTLPEEFLNTEAIKQMPLNEAGDAFQALQNAIKDGDMEAALEMARQMQDSMARMMAALEQGMQEFGQKSMGEELAQLDEIAADIEKLRERERQIYEESQRIGIESQEALLEDQEKEKEKLLEKLKLLIEELNELVKVAYTDAREIKPVEGMMNRTEFYNALSPLSNGLYYLKRYGARLEKLVEDLDLYGLREEIKSWKDKIELIRHNSLLIDSMGEYDNDAGRVLLERANRMGEIVEEILKLLNESLKTPDRMLSEADRRRLKELTGEQAQLEKQTDQLKLRLEELGERLPLISREQPNQLGEASKAMGKAKKKLNAVDPDGALPHEAEALKKLDEASSGLRDLQEKLQDSMAGGVPMPVPMPMGGSGVGGRGRRGYQNPGIFTPGDVPIPGRAGYKVPEKYRQEILRAMRNKSPESYRELNRDYYRKLVK